MKSGLRVLKNSSALSLSVLFERGITFFLPWYVARIQGREVWGKYSTAMTFVTIASSISSWGFAQHLPREVARNRERAGWYLSNASVISGLASLVVTAVVILIVFLLGYPRDVSELIYLGVIVTILPKTESVICEAVISGLERMEWIALARFPASLIRVAGSVFMLMRGANIDSLFMALSIYFLLLSVIYIALLHRFVPDFWAEIQLASVRSLAFKAMPFMLIVASGETFQQIDRVFLSKMWNTDTVGIYATGIMLVQIIQLLAPAIMSALFPGLARASLGPKERFSRLVSQIFRLLLIGIFPVTLTLAASAQFLILFVFGESYTDSIRVFQISAFSLIPLFVARLLFRVILASNYERLAVWVSIAKSVTNVLFNFLLIPIFGVLGASVVFIFSEVVGLLLNLRIVSAKIIQFEYFNALIRPLLIMFISTVIFVILMRNNMVLSWLVANLVFGGLVLASRTLNWTELRDLVTR